MPIKEVWRRIDGPVFGVVLLVACCALTYVAKDRADASARESWDSERSLLVKRIPEVRTEERASCVREYDAKISGMQALAKQQSDDMEEMKPLIQATNDLATKTLQFLGDRARINDQRTAAVLKQSKVAAQAGAAAAQKAEVAVQKTDTIVQKQEVVEQKLNAVDKKLGTAVQPALPAQPWAGSRR